MKKIHTKIVCTIGKKDNRDSIESLCELINAGMNVARINMSHSRHFREEGKYIPGETYIDDSELIKRIREASRVTGKPVAILGDLMGQKNRIGFFINDEVELEAGDEFRLHGDLDKKGDEKGVGINYFDSIAAAFKPGALFLFSDGLIRMKAKKYCIETKSIICEILDNGTLRSNQGVVMRGITPDLPGFTRKDKEDLQFLLDMDVDFIAVSYVRCYQDLVKVRGLIELSYDGKCPPLLITKIETEDAVEHLIKIVCESDGIMVARGDLGVSIDIEDVPIVQKKIIRLCNIFGKPVITATQMLESMIERPFPTRAEATDIANAIFDGTDAIMLSGETAIGNYPIESLKMMWKIAEKAETAKIIELRSRTKQRDWRKRIELGIDELKSDGFYPSDLNRSIADSITLAAAEIAEDISLKLMLTPTTTGKTARLMARFRTGIPIYATVSSERTGRQLLLSHGVFPVNIAKRDTVLDIFKESRSALLKEGILKDRDLFLATSGFPPNTPGSTNQLQIVQA